jgi:hypothetical protein
MAGPLTDGVALRPLADADADSLLAGEDDETVRWLGGAPARRRPTRA